MTVKRTNKEKSVPKTEQTTRYKGSQLLRMSKYNNRIARIVLNVDGVYSFVEADELIHEYLKKKG